MDKFTLISLYRLSSQSMPAMNVIRVVDILDRDKFKSFLGKEVRCIICTNEVESDLKDEISKYGIHLYDNIQPDDIGKTVHKVANSLSINYKIHRREGLEA